VNTSTQWLFETPAVTTHRYSLSRSHGRKFDNAEYELIWETGSVPNLDQAITYNRNNMAGLGWQRYVDKIVTLLGFTNYTPDERTFAQAVANWQQKQGLNPDGKIGPSTWAKMQIELRLQPGVSSSSDTGTSISPVPYAVAAGEKYGSRWKSTRPPGLPTYARPTSVRNAAVPAIESFARAQNKGENFVATVRHLAQTESGAMYARPANTFNALPLDQRQGKALITAWGAFQFNRDAWRSLLKRYNWQSASGVNRDTAFPWDSTPQEEIDLPVRRYAEIFSEVRAAGGTDIDAARGIRLWHITPSVGYSKYLREGRAKGFSTAWQQVKTDRRNRIDNHLRAAGVLSGATSTNQEFFVGDTLFESGLAQSSRIEDRTAFAPKKKRKNLKRGHVYALVLHQMAFSRGNDVKKYDSVTAHFIITPDGKITQLHPISAYLYASNGFNKHSVAVEFAGNFRNVNGKCWKPENYGCHRLTSAQIEAGRYLVRYLQNTIGLTHILAHRQSSGSRTNDPGPEIWYHIGQWSIENLGLKDGGAGFKIADGSPIPDSWRTWGRR